VLDRIEHLTGNDFQRFCSVLLSASDPSFAAVDGSGGDMGNDGFCLAGDALYQAYAPIKRDAAKVRNKIDESLAKAVSLRASSFPCLRRLVFLMPTDLTHEMHVYFQAAANTAGLIGEPWGGSRLAALLAQHPEIRPMFPQFLLPDVAGDVKAIRFALGGVGANRASNAWDPINAVLGADHEPRILVLQRNEQSPAEDLASYDFFRVRVYSEALCRSSFEPNEEDSFRDMVREAFWEDSTAELEAPNADGVFVEHRDADLRFHRRWAWWTKGAIGMAATLRELTRKNSYSAADMAVDVTRFLGLAGRLVKGGSARVIFGMDPNHLQLMFDPSDIRARERLGARLAGVKSVAHTVLERTRETTFDGTGALPPASAARLAAECIVPVLRTLHGARIDTGEFAASIPRIIEATERARSM
jgi:hypothetical protein